MRIPMGSRVDLINPANAPRLLYAGDEWQGESHPHLLIQQEAIQIVGDLDKGLSVDPQFGTLLRGPISLLGSPEDIRVSSYWSLNPMLLCSIGSSAAMPVPTLVPTTPPLLESKNAFARLTGEV